MNEKKPRREPVILSQMRPWNLLLVLCGCILFAFCLIHYRAFAAFFGRVASALGPVFAGCVFAYLLNAPATWLDRRMRKFFSRIIKKEKNAALTARVISSFVVVLAFLAAIVTLIVATFSEVLEGISTLLEHIPQYLETITLWADKLLSLDSDITGSLQELVEKLRQDMNNADTSEMSAKILAAIATGASSTLGFLYDVLVGFIIAVYLLVSKERFWRQFKRILFAFVKPKTAFWLDNRMRIANKTFSTAVLGKMLDSFIIGILCFIGVMVMDMPYAVLITVIVGVTNMIPFFGPIFGAIPCILLILMEDPLKALYFSIFILCLQQFDCNFLDPRIVGGSIGLPAFWELFACLLGGGLFGIIGMAIGVPAFAVVYHLVKELVAERLQRRDLPEDFLRNQLGIEPKSKDSGLFDDDDDQCSPYSQRMILLEDIAPPVTEEETQT